MSNGQQLGLDELMIVNPSPLGRQDLFLGEDGTVYQVHGLADKSGGQELGQLYLSSDGTLYQAQSSSVDALGDSPALTDLGRYFLGEDGQLYERIR